MNEIKPAPATLQQAHGDVSFCREESEIGKLTIQKKTYSPIYFKGATALDSRSLVLRIAQLAPIHLELFTTTLEKALGESSPTDIEDLHEVIDGIVPANDQWAARRQEHRNSLRGTAEVQQRVTQSYQRALGQLIEESLLDS